MIDGQKVTGQEILDGRMMRADYTRKTTELAEERKAIAAFQEKAEDYRGDIEDYFQRTYSNPVELLHELRASAPDTYKALRKHIVDETLRIGEMTEAEYAMHQRLDEGEHNAWKDARLKARGEMAQTRQQTRAQRAEVRKNITTWRDEAMKAEGLKQDNADHQEALSEYLAARHRNERWTEELIRNAAKAVAKRLGVKPPPPPKAAGATVKKDPKTGQFVAPQAPPPIKGAGTRRPPTNRQAAPSKTMPSSVAFEKIRDKFR